MNALNLLVPTIAGFAGILLGGLLAGRNQRNQIYAERMIAAADDFATSATATLSAFYTALSRPRTSDEPMARVGELVPETRSRLTRVVLLFHPDSATTEAARKAMALLSVAEFEISLYFNSDEEVHQGSVFHQMWRRCNEANGALESFLQEAAKAVRRPGRRRFGPRRNAAIEIGAVESGERPTRTQPIKTA